MRLAYARSIPNAIWATLPGMDTESMRELTAGVRGLLFLRMHDTASDSHGVKFKGEEGSQLKNIVDTMYVCIWESTLCSDLRI